MSSQGLFESHQQHPDRTLLARTRAALDAWERHGVASATSTILGTGAVAELETRIAELTGRRFAIAMSSATAALEVAFESLEIGRGQDVVVPSYDWPSSEAAARRREATVVYAPVETPRLAMSPSHLRAVIGPQTAAVVVTHLFGVPADTDALRDAADGVPLVEDCSQALGAVDGSRPVGSRGRLAVFSFGPGKIIDAGEGGVLVTDDAGLARRAMRISQHPVRVRREYGDDPDGATITRRIHPVAAIVAWYELTRLRQHLAARRRRLERIVHLAGQAGVVLPQTAPDAMAGVAVPVLLTGTEALPDALLAVPVPPLGRRAAPKGAHLLDLYVPHAPPRSTRAPHVAMPACR